MTLRRVVLFCVLCSGLRPAFAAEPTLRNLSVRGLQVGGSTTIAIDGDDLGKAPKLLLPFPARQKLLPKSTDKQAAFEVSLDSSIAPGYYHVRVVTEGGVSAPAIIGVDRLPQRPLTKEIATLPIALHGSTTGSTIAEAAFAGKAGQKVIVEIEAERLGSKLRPVVHLYSPKKLQLAWSWPNATLLGDTRLEATLPENGAYTVAIHDNQYAGQSPGFFRLKIGQWNYADRVFPPIVGNRTEAVELLGNSAAKISLAANRDRFHPLPWPAHGHWSGPRPHVEMSSRIELSATDDLSGMLKVGSFAITDRFARPFEESRFRVPVAPGSKMRFEVFAERLGSPVDSALLIRDEKANLLARADDGPGTLDPALDFTAPANVTAVLVGVAEMQGRVGPQSIFRLTVDSGGSSAAGDYRLFTPTQHAGLPANGRCVVPIFAQRSGFHGKIDLNARGLPGGVKVEGTAIAADADGALVTLSGAASEPAIASWRGRGDNGQERAVFLRGHPLEKQQPWLATEFAVAPTAAKAGDFTVAWRGLPDSAGLVPGRKIALPVKISRLDPASLVRLTLLTSQAPPLVNGQPDANRTIRPEKPVELGAKASDGELTALLPAELPAGSYDIAIRAELLSANRQRVLATAFTPVKKLPVRMPIAVKPANTLIAAKLDPKKPTIVEVKGTLVRSEGFAGDAAVTLAGLPAGIAAPQAAVKASETALTIKLTIPPNFKPGEHRGIKLSANAATDPKQPNVRVKSRDVALMLKILPP